MDAKDRAGTEIALRLRAWMHGGNATESRDSADWSFMSSSGHRFHTRIFGKQGPTPNWSQRTEVTEVSAGAGLVGESFIKLLVNRSFVEGPGGGHLCE